MTSLTVNGSAAAATTLAAAGKLFDTTGGTAGNTSTKVGTSTQYKQIFALGTSTNQSGVASIPAPTDSNWHGWMWDVTTLEGQRIAAGTWTPTIHLLASTGTTITPTAQWYKRSSAGGYTSIGSVDGSSIALTTSAQLLVFTAPSLSLMDFATGDKLVMWLWVNQTAGGATNSTISVVEAISGSTSGVAAGEVKTVTPGYAPIPVALSVTIAGVGKLLAASESLYKSTVLADTPIRYYRLDEPSGTTATDIGSQAQNGTLSGTGITLAQTGLLAGDSDTSMLFDGTGVITLPTTGLPTGTGQWTMEAWVYMATLPPNNSTDYEIVSFGTNSAGSAPQLTVNNQHFRCSIWSSGFAGATALAANTIYHAVLVWDGSQVRIYVNGSQDAAAALSPNITTLTWANIGDDNALDNNFTGVIDEVAFYSTGLSSTQVSAHYTAGNVPLGLALNTSLSCTLAGAGTLSGTLSTSSGGVALSVTMAGVGTLTGTISLATSLTTTLAGMGTLTPTLSANLTLPSVTIPGVGTLSGTASLSTALSTTLAGVGTLAGPLSAALTLPATTLAGVGTLTGTTSLTTALTDTLVGVGTLSGTISLATALTTTLAGVGTLTGTLSTTGGVSLSVTMAGVGTLAGTTSLATALTSTLAGVGTLSGPLTANLTLPATTMAGVGTLTGTNTLSTALTDTLAGVGTLTGTTSLKTALSTTFVGVGTLTGTLSIAGQASLTGTLAGVGTLAGTLALSTALAQTFVGVGTLSGAFSLRVALFLTFAGAGTLTGNLSIPAMSYLSATWITRDLKSTWITRDDITTWITRDDITTWKARS